MEARRSRKRAAKRGEDREIFREAQLADRPPMVNANRCYAGLAATIRAEERDAALGAAAHSVRWDTLETRIDLNEGKLEPAAVRDRRHRRTGRETQCEQVCEIRRKQS